MRKSLVNLGVEQLQNIAHKKNIWAFIITLIATMAAGISGLFYPFTFTPLYVLSFIVAIGVFALWLRRSEWALYAVLIIIFLPAGLIPANLNSMLNRSLTVGAFILWLLSTLIRRDKILFTSAAILMLGFITWGLLTFYWVENFEAAKIVLQSYLMRFLLFVFLVPNQIRTLKKLNGLLFTMAVSGWIFLIFSIISLVQQGYTPGMRFKVYDVNENEAGILTLVMLLGILWIASITSKRYKALFAILACLYMAISLGFVAISGSRGSAISFFITLVCFLLWRSTRPWGKLGFLMLLLAIILMPMLFTTTLTRFESLTDNILGSRDVLWQAATRVISEHPVTGVGIAGSSYAILPYLVVPSSGAGVDGTSVHNPVLVVWSETGIIGILLYLGVLATAMGSFIKQYFYYKKIDVHEKLIPYFAFVASVFLGFMLSWIKAGGMQTGYTYFLLIALLLIPSSLDAREVLAGGNSGSFSAPAKR